MRFKMHWLSLWMVLMFACQEADLVDLSPPEPLPVIVNCVLEPSRIGTIASNLGGDTRLTTFDEQPVFEERIITRVGVAYQIWMLQFGADGKIIKIDKLRESIELGDLSLPIAIEQVSGTLWIYALPVGSSWSVPDPINGYPATVTELENRFLRNTPALMGEEPALLGSTEVIWDNSVQIGEVSLRRVAARVNLSVVSDLVDLKSVSVGSVPSSFNLTNSTGILPSLAGSSWTSASVAIDGDAIAPIYLPRNTRGINRQISNARDKIFTNQPAGSSDQSTYLDLIVTPKNQEAILKEARIRIFLGANATDDFNIYPNWIYNVTITINGLDLTDPRVEMNFETSNFTLHVTDDGLPWSEMAYLRFSSDFEADTELLQLSNIRVDQNFRTIKARIPALQNNYALRRIDYSANGITWHRLADCVKEISAMSAGISEPINYTYSWNFKGLKDLESRYEVCSPRTLDNVRNDLSGSYLQVAPINLNNSLGVSYIREWNQDWRINNTYKIGSATGWNPIGANQVAPFRGVYDGQGFSISHLYIYDFENKRSGAQGLFGVTNGATLKGIVLGSYRFPADRIYNMGKAYFYQYLESGYFWFGSNGSVIVGGIVGIAENTDLHTSVNRINLLGSAIVGGLVGTMRGGTLLHCYNSGDAYALDANGGIVGRLESGTVRSVYNAGGVLANDEACPFAKLNASGAIIGARVSGELSNALCVDTQPGIGTGNSTGVNVLYSWQFANTSQGVLNAIGGAEAATYWMHDNTMLPRLKIEK